MNANLHNTDLNSVKVVKLDSSVVVSISDTRGNDISIFLEDLTDAMFLGSIIISGVDKIRRPN